MAMTMMYTVAVGNAGFRRAVSDKGGLQSEQDVSLHEHLALATLFESQSLSVAVALLTAEDVAADALVEHAETVGHEIADVGQIEERQRNADQSIDDRYDATQVRLRSYVTVACHKRTEVSRC